MRTFSPHSRVPLVALSAIAAVVSLASLPCLAQYKVIGPDGKVTYTDREPTTTEGRVVPLGGRVAAQAAEPELPFELRQVAGRYPVTLYTIVNACEPCTTARTFLKRRGIPFVERQVVSSEDNDALEKITGAREAPTVTIGSQTLRGFATDQWSSYLDAAGYPRDSKLPAAYAWRAPTPIVDRRDVAPARTSAAPAAPVAQQPTAAAPAGSAGIRF